MVAWYGHVWGTRAGIAWHASYLSNVHFFLENAAQPGQWGGHLAHFWSLAVAEQFYLVWPWVILFAPQRWLPRIALRMVAAGPVFRLVVMAITGGLAGRILEFGSLQYLGTISYGIYVYHLMLPDLLAQVA